jgi:hypothetical protein
VPDVGESATATLTVTPYSGSTVATLVVTNPDASTATPSASSTDGGATWTATVSYPQVGWYRLAWTVTGTGNGIEYQEVYVSAAPSTSSGERVIVSLERFKRWLRYGTSNADDEKLLDHLVAATEWVEWKIGGPIAPITITERFHTNGWAIVPRKRPLNSVISITPDLGTAIDPSWFIADTELNMIRFYWGIRPCWGTLVYVAGLTTVQRLHRNAGMELARHLWLTQNGSVGRGRNDDDIQVPMGFAVPRRVDEMLTPKTVAGFA